MFLTQATLTGTLPSQLGRLQYLSFIIVSYSDLSGTIPSELGNLAVLERFEFQGSALSGTIPTELINMHPRWFVIVQSNLEGAIPSQFGILEHLNTLTLEGSKLSGSIPSELGAISSNQFEILYLDENRLSGTIPSQIGTLTTLISLNFGSNQLTGSIPSEFGRLQRLTSLTLRHNELSGTIPSQLAQLSRLSFFDISNNKISGSLPFTFPDNRVPSTVTIGCLENNLDDPLCNPPPVYISHLTFSVFVGFSCGLTAILGICGVCVFVFRRHPILDTSNVLVWLGVVVGSMMVCVSIVPFAITLIDSSSASTFASCVSYTHLLSHGALIDFGAIIVRHSLLLSHSGRFVTSSRMVLVVVAAVIVVDVAIMIAFSSTVIRVPHLVSGCDLRFPESLFSLNLAFIALFMALATACSVAVQNIPDDTNETKKINFCVMNQVTSILAGIVVYYTNPKVEQSFIVNASLILGYSLTFLVFLMIPKFKLIHEIGDVVITPASIARTNIVDESSNTIELSVMDPSLMSRMNDSGTFSRSDTNEGTNTKQKDSIIGKSYKKSSRSLSTTSNPGGEMK
eukprot:c12824_g1_i3.p1 GENE.c12824_g1_i3~~c12824_g1_i3.p1  ORF type:complete len:569 (-),score=114.78 c12824_g1_i3:119-1825(-)